MANTNRPFGLRPVRYLNGTPWNGQARAYYVPSSYAVALYVGDPVTLTGTGNAAAFAGYPIGTLATAQIALAGDVSDVTKLVLGSIVAVLPSTQASPVYKPASVEAIIMVADDPNLIFQLQDDGGGSPAVTWIGSNANLISGSGNTYTGQSGWAMDGGTSDGPDGDASNQLFILAASNIPGNDPTSDYAVWDVRINQHCLHPNALGRTV